MLSRPCRRGQRGCECLSCDHRCLFGAGDEAAEDLVREGLVVGREARRGHRPPPIAPASLVVNGAGYHDPDFDALVRVCGDIRIDGGTEVLPNLETAVAVYIALHGETTVDRVRDAVWNGTTVSRKRVRNVPSNVRSVLGDAIRWVDEGRVALGETMTTDLELIRRRLNNAARQSDRAAKAATLHDGLEWVTGRVCTYPETVGSWTWIDLDNWMPHVESTVGTLAYYLAQLYLDLDDPEGAYWAASRGIDATGQREQLTVLLARGYEAAGDEPAGRAAYLAYANEYGIDEPSTEVVVEVLARERVRVPQLDAAQNPRRALDDIGRVVGAEGGRAGDDAHQLLDLFVGGRPMAEFEAPPLVVGVMERPVGIVAGLASEVGLDTLGHLHPRVGGRDGLDAATSGLAHDRLDRVVATAPRHQRRGHHQHHQTTGHATPAPGRTRRSAERRTPRRAVAAWVVHAHASRSLFRPGCSR